MKLIKNSDYYDYGFNSKITPYMICLGSADFATKHAIEPQYVPWVGSTMAPVDSIFDNYVEHPHNAIDYYIDRDIYDVAIDIKEMGSRAIILYDNGKLYVYSRNMKSIELDDNEICLLINDLDKLCNILNFNGIILDTEMLPWSKLSKKLIDKDFITPGILYKIHNNDEYVEKYFEALSNYTEDGPTKFSIFDIVAVKNNDNIWDKTNSLDNFSHIDNSLNLDILYFCQRIHVNLNDSYSKRFITDYWKCVTSKGKEGIVIKPLHKDYNNVPYLKIRGPEYLRLIYGIDYDRNIGKFKNRNLKRKRMQSIAEYIIANKILSEWIDYKNNKNDQSYEDHMKWLFGFMGMKKQNTAYIDATL